MGVCGGHRTSSVVTDRWRGVIGFRCYNYSLDVSGGLKYTSLQTGPTMVCHNCRLIVTRGADGFAWKVATTVLIYNLIVAKLYIFPVMLSVDLAALLQLEMISLIACAKISKQKKLIVC